MAKDFEAKTKRSIQTCKKLIEQRDTAKSKILYNLLDKEISALVNLSNSFDEYVILLQSRLKENGERRSKLVNEAIESANSLSTPLLAIELIEHTKKCYEQLLLFDNVDESIYEQAVEIYLFALSRDYKDWTKISKGILKNIGEAAADIAASLNPVTSIIYFIADKVKVIGTLTKQYQGKDTNYEEIDKELLIIEIHTEIMENTANSFRECSEILRRNKKEK